MALTRINTLSLARRLNGSGPDLVETALDTAFRTRSVPLAQQPIVPVGEGASGSRWVELLARPGVNGARLSADAFINRAMERGLARQLDLLVLASALRWLDGRPDIGLCSVNLSGDSLSQPRFLREVMRLLDSGDVDPSRLCLEVTETVPIRDFPSAREFAREVRAAGCRMALDDFGGGSSNMLMLVPLEMDYIKIDGRFIQPMPLREDCCRIVRGVVALAREIGLRTVAECVEDAEHFRLAREMNVDYIQGYYNHGAPRILETAEEPKAARGHRDLDWLVPGTAR